MPGAADVTPRVEIAPLDVRPVAAGEWLVTWRLANRGAGRLRLTGSWLPHGRFRGAVRTHRRELPPGREIALDLPVRFVERPRAVVENVFLILRLSRDGERWRTLARMTVRATANGAPMPKVEATTCQRVGFAKALRR